MSGELYDDLDPLYREIWGTSLHHGLWQSGQESPRQARAQLIDFALDRLRPRGTIADVGCGYGTLSLRLVDQFPCEVHSFTNSSKQASAIPGHPKIHPHHCDWLDHNLPPESLDQAIALESLSHFEDFEKFARRTYEALKPGGSLLIADWFGADSPGRLLRHLAKAGEIPPRRSLNEIQALASRQGFLSLESYDLSSQAAPTWTALFFRTLSLPFRSPFLLPTLIRQAMRRPALLWCFPLLRLAYHRKSLQYHLIRLKKTDKVSSRPSS